MKRNNVWLITVSFLLLLAFGTEAQKSKTQKGAKKPAQKTKVQPANKTSQKSNTTKEPAQKTTPPKSTTQKSSNTETTSDASSDEGKVKDMVAFLEYMLNTLGSNETSARDKDVLITESYSKVFRDGKVQVEDDLDEERGVITNKDVVAYLKDVDFFFKDVKFEFNIESIKSAAMPNGKLFYKVSLTRLLTGTTAEGKTIKNTMPRFIEVNYNSDDQDLKIVSIYTNEFDERSALTNWWKELSYEWQAIFKKKLNLMDSVQLADIKNITALEELDLSGNKYIQTIDPLAQLFNLKALNLSNTAVKDLTPIRNLTELVELDLSETRIQDLTPLRYSSKLARLNINHTKVNDISVVEKMPAIQNLDIGDTFVADLTPASNLTDLRYLNIEGTLVSTLAPIQNLTVINELNASVTLIQDLNTLTGFKNLTVLNIDSTRVRDITPLSTLENLKVLHANYTLISDLQPLQKLPRLEKIYCDQTPVKLAIADAFMAANPKVLVVFNTRDLQVWWNSLSGHWQTVLSKTARIGTTPAKEELAKVTNLDSINIRGNSAITDLEPLRRLLKLQSITASKTGIKDLSPLQEHRAIRFLDISDTEVSDLFVVRQFTKLKELRTDQTKIEHIDPLFGLHTLEKLYVDHTTVNDIVAREFLEKHTSCLLIYKTVHLNRWWSNLSADWKQVFRSQMGTDTTSTRENLHKLVEQEVFHFKDAPVDNLNALSEFIRLKELHFSGTSVTTIPPLENIKSLRSLHASHGPLQHVEAIGIYTQLEDLDISNTPVDDLKPISSLQNLKSLNCAGTQIKKLDPLENSQSLELFDCSNTLVKNLDPIRNLPLKTLKCYNTKVSAKEVESLKKTNPQCNVVYYR
jgi:Leucine-rich repeat (LRR) protein